MHNDLVLHGGVVHTFDERVPEAEAIWIRDGRVEAVGSSAEIHHLAPSTVETLNIKGKTALPAFTDSHTHFGMYAVEKQGVDLTGADSLPEARSRITTAAGRLGPAGWITGHGWDMNIWPEQRLPSKTDLDDILPDTPAALWSKDVHMLWANSAALEIAGITVATLDPKGAKIERDQHGEPTGILRESAVELVTSVIPSPSPRELAGLLLAAMADAHRLGIAGIHCHGDHTNLQAYQILRDQNRLRLRTSVTIPYSSLDHAVSLGVRTGMGDGWLRIGPLKMFADGALGSRTAAMLQPYNGEPENTGITTLSTEEMEDAVRTAADAGISAAIHAIGDRANRTTIDVLSRHRFTPEGKDLRHRIEHAQLLHPDDIPRLAINGITASMQPIHCTADIDIAGRYWGERSRYAYPFRSLLDSGAHLAFGSDSPVETMDPLAGIYAAATRRRIDGTPAGGWHPQERITVYESVQAYTAGAAYATGEEQVKGTIAAGKVADIVVLSCDILDDMNAILDAHVTHTIVGGEVVYLAEE